MSVFNKNKNSFKNMISEENHKRNPCSEGHTWGRLRPTINPEIHKVQHPELMGMPCDCNRILWGEQLCGCHFKKWEEHHLPNPNY